MRGGISEEDFQDQVHGGNVGAAAAAAASGKASSEASAAERAEAVAKATAAATAALAAEGDGPEAALRSLERQTRKMAFGVGTAALGVLRYLCEHVAKLPLSAASRLLDTHDVPLAMVPLIENPPWTKRSKAGKWFKHQNHAWKEVPPADLLKLTPLEGQPWLAVYNLLCDKGCRGKYAMHSYRRGAIMRIRKYMHDVLLDQLPVLAALQRYLDELQVSDASGASAPGAGQAGSDVPSMFVLEVQPDIHDTVVRTALALGAKHVDAAAAAGIAPAGAAPGEDGQPTEEAKQWAGVAQAVLSNGFAKPDAGDTSLVAIADVYSSDLFEEVVHTQAEAVLEEDAEDSDSDSGVDSDDEELPMSSQAGGAAPLVQVLD